ISRSQEVDYDVLWVPIPRLIAYLHDFHSRYPNATLADTNQGYDNADISLMWEEMESDEEFNIRVASARHQVEYEILTLQSEIEERSALLN
ncbi:hypothetical protein, partial [Listeria monocytogenes]|uniref:hypothetical protein n=1 Tax=Listeria monocytogenes TaxID=1639 RepID=UPI002FDBF610